MPLSRRDFLVTSTAVAAGAVFAASALAKRNARFADPNPEGDDTNIKPAAKKLNILVLGGTGFTGPHFVRLAMKRGHAVTVFNRGKTEQRIGPLPEGVERLVGDRDLKTQNLKALEGDRKWDAVLDTSGYFPRQMDAVTDLLKDRVGQYLFISSISAYAIPIPPDSDEDAPLAKLANPLAEDMGAGGENYGGLKVLCEQAVEKAMPGKTAIVRPTFISGPGDPTDRFTYWPVRVSKGGDVACPGEPKNLIQYIDSRDLAAFLLTLIENKTMGVFNAAGPKPEAGLGDLVTVSKAVSKSDAKFTWIDAAFLEEQGPIGGAFPIWVPPESAYAGMATVRFDRALKAGMKLRPIEATVKDTLVWWPKEVERRKRVGKELTAQAEKEGKPAPKLGDPDKLRAGPSVEDEKKLLEAWAKRQDKKPEGKPEEK